MKNLFVHEYKHKLMGGAHTFAEHTQTYIYQIQDKTFKETTEDFKTLIIAQAYNHLDNAINSSSYSSPKDVTDKLKAELDITVKKQGYSVQEYSESKTKLNVIKVTNTSTGHSKEYYQENYKKPSE